LTSHAKRELHVLDRGISRLYEYVRKAVQRGGLEGVRRDAIPMRAHHEVWKIPSVARDSGVQCDTDDGHRERNQR
jgi:hypothetical protein